MLNRRFMDFPPSGRRPYRDSTVPAAIFWMNSGGNPSIPRVDSRVSREIDAAHLRLWAYCRQLFVYRAVKYGFWQDQDASSDANQQAVPRIAKEVRKRLLHSRNTAFSITFILPFKAATR